MGPSLAEYRPKADPQISGQTAFRYPVWGLCSCCGVSVDRHLPVPGRSRAPSGLGLRTVRALIQKPFRSGRPWALLQFGLVVFLRIFKDWKSVIFGVWVAPGALETLQKGGGRSPPPFARVFRAPRGRPDPQNDRFPILKQF